MAGETQLLELRRHFHCAAYNCAIAVISSSFSEPKFYQGFLFSEKPEKVRAAILVLRYCWMLSLCIMAHVFYNRFFLFCRISLFWKISLTLQGPTTFQLKLRCVVSLFTVALYFSVFEFVHLNQFWLLSM